MKVMRELGCGDAHKKRYVILEHKLDGIESDALLEKLTRYLVRTSS